uniref:Sushi domain-containing protein n=1 Tax=Oryzias latipes TaxID=8090 RepID=A0A3P9H2R8_ORYLA
GSPSENVFCKSNKWFEEHFCLYNFSPILCSTPPTWPFSPLTKYFSLLFLFDLIACSELPNVPHAHITEADRRAEFREGNLIHFDCEAGYTSDQISTFVCTSEGWLATRRGMCFSCSELPDIPNAYVSEETRKAVYQQGDMLRFTCDAGFTSDLPITYVCGSEGWVSIRKGSCYSTTIRCVRPPAHGGLKIKGLPDYNSPIPPDHVLTFSCDSPDKVLIGSSVLICGREGEWNDPIPSCTGKGKQLILFLEKEAYVICSNNSLACVSGIVWSPSPQCTTGDVVCSAPPAVEDADVIRSKTEYQNGESIQYFCPRNGRWTGHLRCIRPCSVSPEEMNQHNILFARDVQKTFIEHGGYVTFKCKGGKLPDGLLEMHQQCVEGVIDLPTCA